MANRRGKVEAVTDFLFLGSKITADSDCTHKIRRKLLLGRKAMTNLESVLKSRHHFADKSPCSQGYALSSSHVQMWELDHKKEYQKIDAFKFCYWRRLLRFAWTAMISNQPSQQKSTLNIHWKDWCWSWSSNTLATWREKPTYCKDSDAEKDWEQEKGVMEDEMVGWHHWLNGHEFEQILGDSEGQGSLVCCCPWGGKE